MLRLIYAGLFTLVTLPSIANAEIYKWKDGNVWRYSDLPPKGQAYEPLKAKKPGNGTVVDAAKPDAKKPMDGEGKTAEQKQSERKVREKACAMAKENLQKLKTSGIVYKENAQGEREYLDEAGMKAETTAAEKEVAATCK